MCFVLCELVEDDNFIQLGLSISNFFPHIRRNEVKDSLGMENICIDEIITNITKFCRKTFMKL